MARTDLKPMLTIACFSEFMTTKKRVLKKAKADQSPLLTRVEARGRRRIRMVTKPTQGLVMTSLSGKVKCLVCGDQYNRSLAPIEPHRYCSRTCEEQSAEGRSA